jgi:hypothetical protein
MLTMELGSIIPMPMPLPAQERVFGVETWL